MSFPSSPSSAGAQSPAAAAPAASSPSSLSEPSTRSSPAPNVSINTTSASTGSQQPSASGAVRRKPTRRANTAERRATHNAVERQRRETLNGRFLDLAALLPNLASVRRPSKSAIVNSSIALVRSQRRLRAIHARQIQQLVRDTEALRAEVNEWRAAHPLEPVPAARASLSVASAPLEPVPEMEYSPEITSLLNMEDTSDAEDRMTEQERIAYEMRGGDSGPLGASIGDEDGDDLGAINEEDYTSVPAATATLAEAAAPVPVTPTTAVPGPQNLLRQQLQQHPTPAFSAQIQPAMEMTPQQLAAAASLVPSAYPSVAARQQQQQQQLAMQQQMQRMASLGLFPSAPLGVNMGMGLGGFSQQPFNPASFDAIVAAASSNPTTPTYGTPQNAQQQGQMSEQDAAKYAAWNAHLFSAALVAQQQQRDQQAQQFYQQQQQAQLNMNQQQQQQRMGSLSPSPSLAGAPSLSLSSSPSSSSVLSISTAPDALLLDGSVSVPNSAVSGSFPGSVGSPLDGMAQDAFGFATPTAWKDGNAASVNATPNAGGGGMTGFFGYPMMSPFI